MVPRKGKPKRFSGSSQLCKTRSVSVKTATVSVIGSKLKRPVKKREVMESIKERKIFFNHEDFL